VLGSEGMVCEAGAVLVAREVVEDIGVCGGGKSGIFHRSGRPALRDALTMMFSLGGERRWRWEISAAGCCTSQLDVHGLNQGWNNRTDWKDVHRERTRSEKGRAVGKNMQ